MVDTVSGANHDSDVPMDWESHPKDNPRIVVRGDRHLYWCKGCDTLHSIRVRAVGEPHPNDGPSWTWDGNITEPTYAPSQLSQGQYVCHTFIRKGVVEFLSDCTHHLRGVSTQLPPLPDWLIEESKEVDEK